MKKILRFFGSKPASALCLLFAFVNRIIFSTLYSQISTDTKVQLTYAHNFMSGKVMGVTKFFTNDLNTPVYDTHLFFPPGFSLIMIPFLKLSDGNEFLALRMFDTLMAVLFVVVVRLLSSRIGLSLALKNIITLIAGCSQYIFFMSWSSTDAIGVCLVLLGLAEVTGIVQNEKNLTWGRASISGLLFCSSFFLRYMYLPVVLLFPILVLFFGIVSAKRNIRVAGGKLLISSFIFLICLFILNSLIAGNSVHINNVGRGLFPDQIVHWYPFIPASFINLDFAAQLLGKLTGMGYGSAIQFFEIINLILVFLFIAILIRFIKIILSNRSFSPNTIFMISGAAISLLIIIMLGYLSLTYKKLNWGYHSWTYVGDERYFSFIYIFIALLLFVFIQYHTASLKKRAVQIFVVLGLLCMTIEVTHGVYYNVKILASRKDLDTIKNQDKGYKSFSSVIAELKQQYPEREILVCSPDQYYLHAASQMGYKAIFDYENLAKATLKPPVKSLLIVPIHTNEIIIMKDYLERKNPRSISLSDDTFFYFEEINPQ